MQHAVRSNVLLNNVIIKNKLICCTTVIVSMGWGASAQNKNKFYPIVVLKVWFVYTTGYKYTKPSSQQWIGNRIITYTSICNKNVLLPRSYELHRHQKTTMMTVRACCINLVGGIFDKLIIVIPKLSLVRISRFETIAVARKRIIWKLQKGTLKTYIDRIIFWPYMRLSVFGRWNYIY